MRKLIPLGTLEGQPDRRAGPDSKSVGTRKGLEFKSSAFRQYPRKLVMKKLLFVLPLLFMSVAHADDLPPVKEANMVSAKLSQRPDLDVADFTEVKCSAKITENSKTIYDDSCRAHIVVSRDDSTVFEFFFDNLDKQLAFQTKEVNDDIDNGIFTFDAKSVSFFNRPDIDVTGKCITTRDPHSTTCHLQSTGGSKVTIDIASIAAIMLFVKADGHIYVPGSSF